MRLDHRARLERLLERHPDIQPVTGTAGDTLIRKDQLLVAGHDADGVHERAARWVARREDGSVPGVTVLHLRPEAKVDVVELTRSLSDGAPHKRVNAGPNHVMTAGPAWGGGPFDEATPTPDVPPAPGTGASDQAVRIGVLDTGISDHPWFTGRKWFDDCDSGSREVPDADLDYQLDSIAGHGTFIAGVLLSQAPEAAIVPVRAIAGDGVTDELRFLHALAAVRTKAPRVDVVNVSLGCYTHDDRPSPVVEQALRALPRETVVVACAGNSGSDRPYWPAALKRVIAVAALDEAGVDRATFSNYGWWVDACTLGSKVVSSFFTFNSAGDTGSQEFAGYATWSGTSFAAPRVAAAIAALAAQRGCSAAEAAAQLLDPGQHSSTPDLGVRVAVSGQR